MPTALQPSDLRAEAAALREAAKHLDASADILERVRGKTEIAHVSPATSSPSPEASANGSHKVFSKDLPHLILAEAGHPMTTKEIADECLSRERKVSLGTVGSYLSRDERIASFGGGKHGLLTWKVMISNPSTETAAEAGATS